MSERTRGHYFGTYFFDYMLMAFVLQKKRAEKAINLSNPFASWAPSLSYSGGAPQLKGARWFSYDELKKCTNNFPRSNEIGSGGYDKVFQLLQQKMILFE
ncbi:hypothetical protein LIER_17584 [Lithospermum erythrorhizon]|uniref:Uncharacterized protein n=1 Tax=Lithospermum erythrorhizon TaxID=34254 RepID=A0AAV3QD97_LITER